jgi:hypothetical protein
VTRIVTRAYRYKRPAKKRKAVALTGPAIVRKRGGADAVPPPDEPEPTAPPPANDDSPPPPAPAARSAIVTTTSRKRVRLERGEKRQAAEPDDDPEATARVKAFFARMIRHK